MTINEARAALHAAGLSPRDIVIAREPREEWRPGEDAPMVSEHWVVMVVSNARSLYERAERLDQCVARIVEQVKAPRHES
jgi:hypothetical protein